MHAADADDRSQGMTHCRSPSTCSVCLGAVPRQVTTIAGITSVDGVPVSSDSVTAPQMPQPRSKRHRYGRGKR